MSICRKSLHSLALIAAAIVISPAAARAQAATDLICSGCVGTNDLANDSIGDRKLKDDSVGDRKIKNNAIGQNKIKDDAIGQNKIKDRAVGSRKLKLNAVQNSNIQGGAVSFDKLDSDVQIRVEDLEQQLDDLVNPAACTNQTMDGAWQAYTLHADENAIRAGWERCEFTVSNNSISAGGGCTNQLGDAFSIVSGSFTMTSQCVVTANLNFSGFFGSASIVHARLDRSRNHLSGVGSASDVGPLMVTVLRK